MTPTGPTQGKRWPGRLWIVRDETGHTDATGAGYFAPSTAQPDHQTWPHHESREYVPASTADALAEALKHLFAGELSRSSGGDPGMIFDQYDAAVESQRRGTVTFDADAVDRARQVYAHYDEGRRE